MNVIHRLCRAGVCTLAVLAGPLFAAPAELAPLRGVFEAHLAQYESECNAELNAWVEGVRGELGQLAQAAQRAGQFEAWQEATREAAQFEKTQRLPEETPPDASDTLKALHQRNRAAAAQCVQRRMQRTLDLATKYLARLEALKAEATRQGAFEEAAAWQAEVQRVEALPILQRARQEAVVPQQVPEAPSGASATPEAGPGGAAATPDGGAQPEATPEASTVATEGLEGVVWSEGLTPPAVPGLTFRPVTLSLTERMRVSRRLGARAELASSTATQRSDFTRNSSGAHVLRLGLRPADAGQAIEGATLLVEFYGKDAARRGAHIVPRPIGTLTLPLPRLDGARWVFVQLPPVSTERTVHRYPFFNAEQRYGLEYYGVVISVFDASNALMFQAISAPNLAALALEKMPETPAEEPEAAREFPPRTPRPWAPRPVERRRPFDGPRPAFGDR